MKCPICQNEFDILETNNVPPQIDIKYHEYDVDYGKYIGERRHIYICHQCDIKIAEAIKNSIK